MNTGDSVTKQSRTMRLVKAAVVLIALLLVWLTYEYVLVTVALPLVRGNVDPDVDCLIILDHHPATEPFYEAVANWARRHPQAKIVLLRGAPSRLIDLGIVKPKAVVARQVLLAHGIAAERMEIPPKDVGDFWEAVAFINTWLFEHPGRTIAVATRRFSTRSFWAAVKQALYDGYRERVQLALFPEGLPTERNWWKSRSGWKAFFNGWVRLAYSCAVGQRAFRQQRHLSPEQYEGHLQCRLGIGQ